MYLNSLHLLTVAVLATALLVPVVLWRQARARAVNAERRLARATARADVVLLAAEEWHDQLTERERAIAAGRIESRRLRLVAS